VSIDSSDTDTIAGTTSLKIRHRHTDHLGTEHRTSYRKVPLGFDTATDQATSAAAQEDSLYERELQGAISQAERGLNPDRVPDHQAQIEFDRRLLGRLMLILDAHTFYAALPFFQAVEGRGGANANQRAAYLGTDRPTYDLIADRFGDVQGIAFFLDNAKGQVWDELPAGFE